MSKSQVEPNVTELEENLPKDQKNALKLNSRGVMLERFYTSEGVHPFDQIKWEYRTASITNEKGEVIFEQKDIEVPDFWSQLAVNVVVSKYFHGKPGTPERETSVKQLIGRVVNTTTEFGWKDGYFVDEDTRETFRAELAYLLVNQHLAFNSPVWFNVGIEANPQTSACFINSVKDNLESIMDLAKTEGMLFKYGSGTGTNLSPLRASKESLSGGGTSSGPISFMRGFDAFAGVIKSGGKTRRAAKMVILNDSHPDIVEFITSKANEEKKAWALIDAGYDGSFNGEAYSSIAFQNANHSVRVSDDFLNAVINDEKWTTKYVTTGEDDGTHNARDMMQLIADSTHICGDPGLQYDSTINKWHTCKNSGRINASNPCSEYVFLDDTACNLASINLMKYLNKDGTFDIKGYIHTIDTSILAQEIFVGNASYPTKSIEANSHVYRTLGLGYANLGAVLMSKGLPYDSDKGRDYASALTSIMTGEAYNMSARIAEKQGAFSGFAANREPMLEVIDMHREASEKINRSDIIEKDLYETSLRVWREAFEKGKQHGYRNAQVSVLAPTGTIAFLMDCDTTGIEPDIALVKYKKLVGGGFLKIVNNTVPQALRNLGYSNQQTDEIVSYIDENETIEGAPALKEEHLPVFDCAFRALNGTRSIHYMGHVRMMAAVQPFISGAISKTVNMPTEATVEEIYNTYLEAWKLGIKAVAIYRDGCKRTQPLNTSKSTPKADTATAKIYRKKLPDERASVTHKFSIAGHEGYITVGMYEDGNPGEVFITMAKEGSTISGLMDSFATSISLALQYGVPLKVLIDKFAHSRFEPSGFTQNKNIPFAKSIMDYIFRWMALKFDGTSVGPSAEMSPAHAPAPVQAKVKEVHAPASVTVTVTKTETKSNGNGKSKQYTLEGLEKVSFLPHEDSPPCMYCGSIMVRNGSCYKCINCGGTSGCS
jgi:ribonucleoside-diphosphate reductase alpha chain